MVVTNSDRLPSIRAPRPPRHRRARRHGGGHVLRRRLWTAQQRARRAHRPEGDVAGRTGAQPGGPACPPAAVLSNLAENTKARSAQAGRRPGERQERDGHHGHGGPRGDKVQVIAYGPDAGGGRRRPRRRSPPRLGEEGVAPIPEARRPGDPAPVAPAPPRRRSEDPNVLLGVAASPGSAWARLPGPARGLRGQGGRQRPPPGAPPAQRRHRPGQGPARGIGGPARHEADADKAAIFAAHREILRDPDLMDLAMSGIDKGKTAAYAWRRAYQLCRPPRPPQERGARRARRDVRDVGQRVLQEITGQRSEKAEMPAARSWWPRS